MAKTNVADNVQFNLLKLINELCKRLPASVCIVLSYILIIYFMAKKIFFASLLFFVFIHLHAQQNKIRYKYFIFNDVTINKNIIYKNNISDTIKKKYYLLDLYEPSADTALQRPLLIWMHGGGFKFGSKNANGTPRWAKTFAQRGFVCAAINYRLSRKKPLVKFPDLVEGCYDVIEDVKTAIAFFKKNAALYKIDTNRIILGGNSAGGIAAMQAVYSSTNNLQQLINNNFSGKNDDEINPMHIAGIINFWGAVFNTEWLRNTRVPIVSAQGTNDRIVPYDHKNAPLYGTFAIHKKADSLQIPNALKSFDGYGHELHKHFNPFFASARTKKRWMEAGQFAADFLYEQLFK